MKIFSFIAFIVIATSGFSQEAINKNLPKIEFKVSVYDFGEIEYGSPGNYDFVFKNVGKGPLIIKSVKSSWGCTIPRKPKGPIKKRKKDKISVHYNTKKVGAFNKTITVYSNASNAVERVQIKGKVLPNKKKVKKEQINSNNKK